MAGIFRRRKKFTKASPVAPKVLRTPEEDFFLLVGEGNVYNLKLFIKKHLASGKPLDFNANSFRNTNAMGIAVEAGNWDMVKYLLTLTRISKRRVLLKAIHKGNVDLVMRLCEEFGADTDSQKEHSVGEEEYPPKVTPLMLAAMEGHFEIIGYLIGRGHSIPVPHPPSCICKEVCLPRLKTGDKLDLALDTFYQYSAMCSPKYFVYTTNDPIYYAFEIHKRIMDLADIERPLKIRYEKLAQTVRQFTADLVGECRDAKEIEIVLNENYYERNYLLDKYVPPETYPRLLMAMEYNQKEFVTHPKVQLFIRDKFYGSFVDWKYYSNLSKLFFPIIRFFTFPSAVFCILLYPASTEAKFYAAPLNRMLHCLVFYVVFLAVLLLESLRDKSRVLKANMSSIWTAVILVYFCTMTASIVHQILHLRPARFFRNGWNIFDIIMLTMFGFYLAFNVASMFHYVLPHVRDQERKFWAATEPQLAAEGFLVISTVLAYLKLMFFLQAHTVMGPLQVALGQMIKTCARYSFFDLVVLLAYTTAFSKFYAYYEGMTYHDPASQDVSYQEQSFINWMSSFKTFFWAMFTQVDPAVADVVVENRNGTDRYNNHVFTELVGYIALGTFSLLVVMVIVNMLIAAISETFGNILNDVRKSWLFVRTEMYIYFMNYPILPPPFNFIPHCYKARLLRDKADCEQARAAQGQKIPKEKYIWLVHCLFERYLSTMKRREDNKERPVNREVQKWLDLRTQSL